MATRNNSTGERQVNTENIHTILGAESSFEGKLSFEGTVRVDGIFKGEIHTNDVLVIGQGAKVEAEVQVGSIIINGEVRGNVTAAGSVEIHAPGKVYGNIITPELIIDKGVVFEGNCKMENRSSKATPPKPPPVAEKSSETEKE